MGKIVFFDVDGTLVDDRTQIIPESTKRAIDALRRAGHLAVVNTGRPPQHIDGRILDLGWDGIVAGCGMWVQAEGKVIHSDEPGEALCRSVRELVRACHMDGFFEAPHGLTLDGEAGHCPEVAREVRNILARGLEVRYNPDEEGFRFLKLVTYDRPDSDVERFLREISDHFTAIDRRRGMRELVPGGNTKSTGIRRILDHFGLDTDDAYAFGDSTNDLPMFQCVGTSVAMGGGDPRLLELADLVTDTVLSDGIQKGLERLGLIPCQSGANVL